MNATEQSLNKPSTSILSDSSISTTTVELGNLELNLESFSAIAKKLIEAGWDGDEGELEFSGKKKDLQCKYGNCVFPERDLQDIRSVVLRQLGKTSGDVTSDSVNSLLRNSPLSNLDGSVAASAQLSSDPSIPENTYENALELIRNHLLGLQNCYLGKNISDKLEGIKTINWFQEETFIKEIIDPKWPVETKECFKIYIGQFRKNALQNTNSQKAVATIVEEMMKDLQQVVSELKNRINANIREYDGWKEFQSLFEISAFAALSNENFIKICRCIDQKAPDELRDFVDTLSKMKVIDLDLAEKELKGKNYEYDLDTLLGQVIARRPLKSEGIVTYWNQPSEFFVGKTFSLITPEGMMQNGFILRCVRNSDKSLELHLDDHSEVHIQNRTFQTTIVRIQSYNHLIGAIETGSLVKGDVFTIRHHSEASSKALISAGEYRLQEVSRHKGGWTSKHFLNPYSEYIFEDPNTNQVKYRLRAESHWGQITSVHVEKWIVKGVYSEFGYYSEPGDDSEQGFYLEAKNLSLYLFERCHIADKKIRTSVPEVNVHNAEKYILIKNELDEDRVRRKSLEQINEELKGLLQAFQDEKNDPLLEILLNNLIKNEMKAIDVSLLTGEHTALANDVRGISRKYFDLLQINRTAEQILLQTVLEANYVKLVNINDNILISRTMMLLREAKEHINNIANHDLVLFMGNTGAGKSTSIAYLMQASLTKKQNHIGEDVFYVSDRGDGYPKIGQSVVTSETIYTQGYSVNGLPYLLGDCPGFNDTRGGDYELCTNFSIDQAISKSKKLLSLVIVLPVSAFLMDKGNLVIDLINSVKDRFPTTFDPYNLKNSAQVHLLLTKQGQSKADVVNHMKNGTTFERFVKETQDQIDRLTKQGSTYDSFEVQSMGRRKRIWQAITQMHQYGQVRFIDIRDKQARIELLNTYSSSTSGLDKQQYLPAMAGEHMHKKFGDSVQLAAHAWINLILGKYLTVLPQEILESNAILNERKSRLEEYQNEKSDRLSKVKALEENIQKLSALIQRLKENEEKIIDDDLRAELLAATAASTNSLVSQQRIELSDVEKKLEIKAVALSAIRKEISNHVDAIFKHNKKIEENRLTITDREKGDHTQNLFSWKPDPNAQTTVRYGKEGWRERALQENRNHTKDDDGEVFYNGIYKDYKGQMEDVVTIERGYRLVPEDLQQRKEFLSKHSGGGFVATVSGNKYKIDLESTASTDGKKVSYAYVTDWNGTSDIPHISIDFTIPKKEYHYAEIIGLRSSIGALEEEIQKWNLLLNGGEGVVGVRHREKIVIEEIGALEKKKTEHEKRIEELLNDQVLNQVKQMLTKTEMGLSAAKTEKKQIEDSTLVDEKIFDLGQEIIALDQKILKIKKNSRNLAIIIKTQWDSANLLREFAENVCGFSSGFNPNDKITEGQHLNATVKTCKEFIELFDQHKDTLLQKIKEEYGF